jgi:hypothetical protein
MANDLVIVIPPERLATFIAEGGYLPRGCACSNAFLAFFGFQSG